MKHYNHTTPLYTLPPELTSLIFALAKYGLSPSDARRLPLKLSHTTRRWRAIALSTGSLWTDIDISPADTPELISAYLTRSHPYPIDLTFHTHPDSNPRKLPNITGAGVGAALDAATDRTLGLISPHLVRCRTLHVTSILPQDTHCPALMRLIAQITAHPLPQLRQLSLDRTGAAKTPLTLSAPLLTHLRLSGSRALAPNPSLRTLTTLHLAIPTPYAQLSDTLAACPALTTLAIYERSIEDWPTATGPIDLPGLKSLQLYGHRMCKVSELLLALDAPGLVDLVIAPVVPSDLALLHAAAEYKFPDLRMLTIAPAHADALEVIPVAAECFPGVKHLALANIYMDGFVEALCGGGEVPWPGLETLAVRRLGEGAFRAVRTALEARRERGCMLKTLFLDGPSLEKFGKTGFGGGSGRVEARDVWTEYQDQALFRDLEDMFLGRPDDDD